MMALEILSQIEQIPECFRASLPETRKILSQ